MTQKGGARPGAGRPRQVGLPGEASKVMRIPVSRVAGVREYLKLTDAQWPSVPWPDVSFSHALQFVGRPDLAAQPLHLPLFAGSVPAGFPSPAEDFVEAKLDLNEFLVEHEAATFYIRVKGHSMTEAGILNGDIIAVDRALEPQHGDIVLAVIDGDLTVKELFRQEGQIRLLPHHPDFTPIEIREGQELAIWGVVKGVVRKLR